MKFSFSNSFVNQQEKQNKIEYYKKEEVIDLERFYREILTPETLEKNFIVWKDHLMRLLHDKYPNKDALESALSKATEYAKKVPLRHSTIYKNIRESSTPNLSSTFIVQSLEGYRSGGAGTTYFDVENELDHFVYCHLGVSDMPSGGSGNKWDTQAYIDNKILEQQRTIVSLEDWAFTGTRVVSQNGKGGSNTIGFDIQNQQTWRGVDFNILFPMMLAYSYNDLEDFENKTPFPMDFVPEGLPRLVEPDSTIYRRLTPEFPHFEVRIPVSVPPNLIICFFVNESAVKNETITDSRLVVVPDILSSKDKQNFIKEKVKLFQGSDKIPL